MPPSIRTVGRFGIYAVPRDIPAKPGSGEIRRRPFSLEWSRRWVTESGLVDALAPTVVLTARLEVRLPRESDRDRFVELFGNEDFMVFSPGVLTVDAANDRFDEMLMRGAEIAFAKQPLIEQVTGLIIGYAGVNWFGFESQQRLEFGYRLIPEAPEWATPQRPARRCLPRQQRASAERSWPSSIRSTLRRRSRSETGFHVLEAGNRRWVPRQRLPPVHSRRRYQLGVTTEARSQNTGSGAAIQCGEASH